jgi:hypothetical protein
LKKRFLGMGALFMATSALLAVGMASPAQAATACRTNSKKFVIEGKSDVTVKIQLCVTRSGNDRRATAIVQWNAGDKFGTPFDGFLIKLRLEHDQVAMRTNTLEAAPWINNDNISRKAFWTTTYPSSARGSWTADATVSYNINDDGKGDKTWQLHGSPSIS